MKPFNIRDTCDKCLCKNIKTSFCSGRLQFPLAKPCPTVHHLHRTCSRCGYSWLMEAADVASEELDLTE